MAPKFDILCLKYIAHIFQYELINEQV